MSNYARAHQLNGPIGASSAVEFGQGAGITQIYATVLGDEEQRYEANLVFEREEASNPGTWTEVLKYRFTGEYDGSAGYTGDRGIEMSFPIPLQLPEPCQKTSDHKTVSSNYRFYMTLPVGTDLQWTAHAVVVTY